MTQDASTAQPDAMLYRVVHETAYTYATPVELAHHLAHLCPLDQAAQKRIDYVCDIHPEPEHRHSEADVFGNRREFFAYYSPHDTLTVRAVSLVQVRAPLAPDWDASPPWQAVREQLLYRAGKPYVAEAEFTFGTHFAPLFAEAGAYAAPSFPADRPLLSGALDLMRRIHADFTYNPESTEVQTRAPQALELRAGVCQDYAHVMISALRSLGLAARYVSGYLRSHPKSGEEELVGVDASHAWVAVWCPVNGWVEFDPTNNRQPAADYVRVALGRDFADVSPLRGVIRGGGDHTLRVGVHVSPVDPR
ncbi:MAG: transglutaminase family protein [Thiomonas sp.]|uniref:transglutaminase family protein n=1 Tax=Thiomonas sp. TaxID=2047785 RepID=UPI002A367CC0|nr:transglutaminase family protein [Thiomonas sp.]MDY0331272.1 transglutaminase family protein [Thiomonas sp.]